MRGHQALPVEWVAGREVGLLDAQMVEELKDAFLHRDLTFSSQAHLANGVLRPQYLPPRQYAFHQGPHAQLAADGQGFVQQRHGFLSVTRLVALEQRELSLRFG